MSEADNENAWRKLLQPIDTAPVKRGVPFGTFLGATTDPDWPVDIVTWDGEKFCDRDGEPIKLILWAPLPSMTLLSQILAALS